MQLELTVRGHAPLGLLLVGLGGSVAVASAGRRFPGLLLLLLITGSCKRGDGGIARLWWFGTRR